MGNGQEHLVAQPSALLFLHPRNQSVLAFLRRWEEDTILVVANLASTTQPVELGGRRSLRQSEASSARDVAASASSQASREVVLGTVRLYLQAVRAREVLAVLAENAEVQKGRLLVVLSANRSATTVTRNSQTNFYFSFTFLPRQKREAIHTVYAFCRQTDRFAFSGT